MTALKRVSPLFTKPRIFPLDPADALRTFRQWAKHGTTDRFATCSVAAHFTYGPE